MTDLLQAHPSATYWSLARTVAAQFRASRRRTAEVPYLAARLVFRPVSFLLTPAGLLLGLSANAVTLINAILLVLALVSLAWGTPTTLLVGGSLFLFATIIDYVDGNIARFHNSASLFGKLIDSLVDTIGHLHFAALGLGLAVVTSEGRLMAGLPLLGIGISFTLLLQFIVELRVTALKLEAASLQYGLKEQEAESDQTDATRRLSVAYFNWVGAQPIPMILALGTGQAPLYLIASGLIHGMIVPVRVARLIARNRTLGKAQDPRSQISTPRSRNVSGTY